MDVQAVTKYVRLSPTKARDFARAIQGLPVPSAVKMTALSERKAAALIGKTLKSAVANAENNAGLSAEDLIVKKAVIEEGPRMRRFRAGARGMYKPYRKKMSHIRIVIGEQ